MKPIIECHTHLIFRQVVFFKPALVIFRKEENIFVSETVAHSGGEEGRFLNDTLPPF
jgi:hypothetical protein